ncbi:hypothetical protein [Sulfuracidifex metallicus]|uniref:Uncharacterized protein n=1 Tax=Sulfuracidifex metallicus DSM 6482 = JCM 9184 TaxID=523847 RepID=A0A6A9QFY6_SULME|nr:hypothetical protein [Sulfuracidifex metallicus]MUN28137.1 hypothetical protein [Sulfuracidifex metallicus DSM 6482 = JCM 9184]WOE51323.1 hypothetical protein RQ359_000599 [Sulfuracidifex metallicus DSM 6482 = JCM 9184]
MKFIDFLLKNQKIVIYSYYKMVSAIIILEVGRRLFSQGEKVCVIHGDELMKYLEPDFPFECMESSKVLVYDPEDIPVPKSFLLLTTFDKKKKYEGSVTVDVNKVGQNLYVATSNCNFRFRIVKGKIEDVHISTLEENIISFLQEFGESTLKEISDIISSREKVGRDEVRRKLLELRAMGMIEINGTKVTLLNNNSRLHR